ncbi:MULTISPECIES: hypothetical protein [unclassified Streptomyces]|uniref:hypothetical protein n=1 Tax=unclassified Streptomyces TaxID=2593676 RepID=UPI003D8C32C1
MTAERVRVLALLLFGDQAEIVADVPPAEQAEPERYPATEIADAIGIQVHDLPGVRLTAEVGEDGQLSDWRFASPPDRHITLKGLRSCSYLARQASRVTVSSSRHLSHPSSPPRRSLPHGARRATCCRGAPLSMRASVGGVTLVKWSNLA